MQNNHLKEYRNKNLRKTKLREVMGQFERHFIIAAIKQQWHNLNNLLTNYKREKRCKESSKPSGPGSSKVCTSNGPYYISISFSDNTHEMNELQNSLSPSAIPEKKRNFPPKLPQKMMNFHQRQIYGRHSTTK